MRLDKRWWLLLALLAGITLFFAFDLGQYLNLATLKRHQATLEAWRAAQPLQAALAFFAAYVLVTALSLPGAAVMTLAVGAVFGLGWGTLIVSFASSIGALLAFLAARWLLGDWVQARFADRLATLNAGMARDGAFYLFTLRLVPILPFFVINLVMGLTRIRPLTFYGVSQLGMLPGTLVYVNAGTQLGRIDSLAGILSPGLLGALVLLGVFPLVARKLGDALRARKVYAGWTRPRRFDRNLVVIGGGSAGLVTAYIAAAVRAKVTLVEQGEMGGDCLNTGCVPSKALIRSARFLSQVARAPDFGVRSASADHDFADLMERVQRVVQQIAPHDSVARYTALGVDVAQGRARIVSPWQVEITQADGQVRTLSTRSIVVATGGQPLVPDIPGLDQVGYLTSETVWALRQRPGRLLVLGGGPIGCELAQTFARLGSQVTQVHRGPRLLPREDADAAELVAQGLRADGVALRLGHEAVRCEVVDGQKTLVATHAGAEVRIAFDTLLLAVGRQARLEGFGLQELGVVTGRTLQVNGLLQTNFPNIYAAGDVAGPYQFTHVAAHQAWYAAVNALFAPFKSFQADYRVIPWATFTEPEVARVGLNEDEARARKIPHEVTVYDIADLDRAIADSEARGFVKVLTPPGRDRILGVTIVGAHAAELIAEYVLAMKHGIGLNKILGTIHIYPTMAEANKYAAGQWKRAHAPQKLLGWVERFHGWRRG
ncbi:FAD-dependent oxidoreductase [Pseudorhodoferax sp. Leaf267]|uniref:FAD-dependent oxidoreductase n=1 Tax=Pseudorhodoferax sp. Leaf267 TaxID=1736316 RepID=UPI0006FCADB9|nr:bifunctional TVP38/TMEM64 family protein/FAD-dependent oxidoreductase [Pseudorhodoferax sp. Leaf267]KQP23102.1 pyridine nucleotide-disulfide oxidoreductase [Pseudorhodoferax sp. Leaf267]